MSRSRRCPRFSALFALALSWIPACQTAPPADPLPPVHPPGRNHPVAPPPPDAALPPARAFVLIRQLALPLDRSTDAAWDRADENAFPDITRSVWNANGLRIGLIPRDDLNDLIAQLPHVYANQTQKLIASDHPTAVRRSPPLRGTFTVDLTIPPLAVREQRITGGRAQMLLATDADRTLFLTPHHHKTQARLTPVSVLEKELDGRLYHELTLAVALPQDQALILGLHRPWPPPEVPPEVSSPEVSPPDSSSPDSSSPESSSLKPSAPPDACGLAPPSPPPLPDDLGRALLTGQLADKPVQLLLIITTDPLTATGP